MAAAEPASSGPPAPQGQRPPPASPAPPSQLGGPAGGSSRHEKSLGLLTAKFVSLLQEAQDGVLDLKAVSAPGGGGAAGEGTLAGRRPPRGLAGPLHKAPRGRSGRAGAAAVPGRGGLRGRPVGSARPATAHTKHLAARSA